MLRIRVRPALTGRPSWIVVSDPRDLPMIDELGVLLATPIKVAVGPKSAIESILKKSESSTRVLEDATESFQLQLLKEEENGEDSLTVERLTSDISPVIRLVDSTIYTAIQRRASDIHIETQDDSVHVKCGSTVCCSRMPPIDKRHHSTIISRVKVVAELDIAEKRVPQDGRFKHRLPGKTIDFRCRSCRASMGRTPSSVSSTKSRSANVFESSGSTSRVSGGRAAALPVHAEPYGMVLVTGPTEAARLTSRGARRSNRSRTRS